MESWIFLHIPIEDWQERWISNYERIFDAWEDGGVRGLAVGRLRFRQEDGSFIGAFAPDPKVYETLGVSPPPETPREPEKERKLQEILDNAASRGWPIMIFDIPGGGGGVSVWPRRTLVTTLPKATRSFTRSPSTSRMRSIRSMPVRSIWGVEKPSAPRL